MARYKVSYFNKEDYDKWNDFVEESPEGTIFHRTDWLDIVENFFIIGCYNNNNELIAGMPCCVKRKYFLKVVANPPLTPYQGIIFKKIEGKNYEQISKRKSIAKEILEYLDKNYKNTLINLSPSIIDIQPYTWAGFRPSVTYTYLLRMDNLAKVEALMTDSLRSGIRKAIKDGLIVDESEDFNLLLELVKKTFKRQGKEFSFEEYAKKMDTMLSKKNMRKIFLTLRSGKPIGGVYIIFDSKRSYYLLGGYDSENSHYGASALAIWTAIQYTKEKLNLSEFDFEGSSIPEVERFFRQYGGDLTPYYKVSKIEFLRKLPDMFHRFL